MNRKRKNTVRIGLIALTVALLAALVAPALRPLKAQSPGPGLGFVTKLGPRLS
jgi:hypothetical protein